MTDNALFPPEAERLRKIHTLSLLAPARRYEANFDVTAKQALPAILECALMLISQLEQVSAGELQDYFGLNAAEREGLLKEILETGFAEEDRHGLLVPTSRLRDTRNNLQDISLEEIVNYNHSFVVDSLTHSIQPRADDKPVHGLPALTAEEQEGLVDTASLFTSQFERFQQCTNIQRLKRFHTKLYRINHCHYTQLTTLPLSLDIYAECDPLEGLRLTSELTGFPEQVKGLLTSSGLHGAVNKHFDQPLSNPPQLSLAQYAQAVGDPVLARYIDGYTLDLGKLLLDRKAKRTGYGNSMTQMMIGPLYMDSNRGRLLNWLSSIPRQAALSRAVWLPAATSTWGAYVGLKEFITTIDKALSSHDSTVDFVVPVHDKQERYDVNERFGARVPHIIELPNAPDLNEMEIFIIPGDPGCALVQYHACLPENCGMAGITLPIGYYTYDVERVELLWSVIRQRLGSDITFSSLPTNTNKTLEDSYAQLKKDWQSIISTQSDNTKIKHLEKIKD
ncbi:hypothetical protein FT673_23720 [Aeromonas hydrophila]|nr:hypothetical protein FT673_23720 [Aeromonas hydrophila]